MAIQFRQAHSGTLSAGTSVNVVLPSSVQAGSLLVAWASKPMTTLRTWSIQDQAGRSLTLAKDNEANSSRQAGLWYYANHPGGATTLTLTASGSTSLEFCVAEYSGAALTDVLGGVSELDNGTAATHYAAATTGFNPEAGSLITAAFTTNGILTTLAAGGGYTELLAKPNTLSGAALHSYLIAASTLVDERPSMSTTGTARAGPAVCAWFKPAPAGRYSPFRSHTFQSPALAPRP
jgi:hypothetical protein